MPTCQPSSALWAFLSVSLVLVSGAPGQATVVATLETAPVPSAGDAADDMAVWVHPTDPGLSRIIGADKEGNVVLYDLAGNQLQALPDGGINNVDIRYGFPLGGEEVALVTSGERDNNVLAVYKIDPVTNLLVDVAAGPISLGFDVYGCCMYESALTGDVYFIGTSDDGEIRQWRLFDTGAGTVDATLVRTVSVSGTTEGCVADDEMGYLFVAEEEVGIWRFGAEPTDTSAPLFIDATGVGGNLTADVEGLSIYYAAVGQGYLLASSQGNDSYVVYDRQPPHAYLHTFTIGANPALGIDGVSHTDGIDVVNLPLGSAFPEGAFLVQDDENPGANQNFKLVPWADVANSASPPLLVDTTYDAFGALEPEPWTDLGGGTPGIQGTPLLVGGGTLVGGTPATLDLTQAAPSSIALLWISIASTPVDVIGGTIHTNPVLEQYVIGTNGLGNLPLSTTWPSILPSGTCLWFQYVLQDVSVPVGITLSNGLKATTP